MRRAGVDMSISQDALRTLAVRKNWIAHTTLHALNLELHKARSLYPGNENLFGRLQLQLEKLSKDALDPKILEFELWSSCIVTLVLIVRFMEEGDRRIFDGLKSPELEKQLDALEAATR